ncbi:MAG: hypothetical protein CM1200mP14_12040 [Gammaproteobacteria bacterium]|nr:MAG: hypothetical protein CM1200mP14_12040 [Gammaproteobacteria bacterium]
MREARKLYFPVASRPESSPSYVIRNGSFSSMVRNAPAASSYCPACSDSRASAVVWAWRELAVRTLASIRRDKGHNPYPLWHGSPFFLVPVNKQFPHSCHIASSCIASRRTLSSVIRAWTDGALRKVSEFRVLVNLFLGYGDTTQLKSCCKASRQAHSGHLFASCSIPVVIQ